MDTTALKSFATGARSQLLQEVASRLDAVLDPGSPERRESAGTVARLERSVGQEGRQAVVDRVAYTWFNRIVALRFMDANRYNSVAVVSPPFGQAVGQPEVLAEAKAGTVDARVLGAKAERVIDLLSGRVSSPNPQQEAYRLLLTAHCNHLHASMSFMFEQIGDETELLMPADLLSENSVIAKTVAALSVEACADVEVIGWLYQFYIAERKDEVFAGFKKNKKAGPAEIPAATQLFTPHWIVRFLVENSLGRLWLLNHPSSQLAEQMDYYLAPVESEIDFLNVSSPKELKVIDPACGSGHMLTYAFDLLYAIYEEQGYAPADIPGLVLTNNLYGTEIDPRAAALAAFALTMKARAKQRTFFNKQVEPNVCVIEPISFGPDELDFLVTRGGDRHEEIAFWNQFAHADTRGSLIRPDPGVTARLARHLEALEDGGDIYRADAIEWAKRVVHQAVFLSGQYSVVIANPPYMGTGSMDARLSQFVKADYPRGKADLFACFIIRSLELCRPMGRVAMITMHSWMFLSSYTKLREVISREHELESMAHLGTGAFDTIGGEVVSTTAFVVAAGTSRESAVGTYVRLVNGANESQKAAALRAVSSGSSKDLYRVLNADMAALPGGAISYWMNPTMLRAMTGNTLLGEISEPRCGMNTGENARFVRNWWEVDRGRSQYEAQSTAAAHASGCKWFPYNKGGTYRKWYGNQQSVVAFDAANYDILSKQGNHLPSRQYYFHPAVSWSKVAGSSPSFRYFPPGFIFDGAGMSLFADTSEQRFALLGLLNSNVSLAALEAIAPTLNFQSGDIARLPLPKELDETAVGRIVEQLVETAKDDWDRQEVSWNFNRDLLVGEASSNGGTLVSIVDAAISREKNLVETQRRLEEANNLFFMDAFGMHDEFNSSVGVSEVTLLANPMYRYGETRLGDHQLRRAGTIADLLSYTVGCMFGRYSLDEPGLILADQGVTLQDYLARVPTPSFTPDADNVIPILADEWFPDDVVGRFREFMKVVFGEEHFEENLRFVEESLGKGIRKYFLSDFYKDHVQRYKKQPIYWMFSSPKGSFNALIYMHRYRPDTVSVVLNKYLREFQAKLSARLSTVSAVEVSEAASAKEKTAARKEADQIRKMLTELSDYEHDVLYPLATRQIAIDLDDGVKANYPKFGPALKKIPGLVADE